MGLQLVPATGDEGAHHASCPKVCKAARLAAAPN